MFPKIKTSWCQTLGRTLCTTQWLPESPRFNILTGHTEKAMATLVNIAKENGKTLPPGKIVALKQVRLQRGDVHPTQGLVVNNILLTFCLGFTE